VYLLKTFIPTWSLYWVRLIKFSYQPGRSIGYLLKTFIPTWSSYWVRFIKKFIPACLVIVLGIPFYNFHTKLVLVLGTFLKTFTPAWSEYCWVPFSKLSYQAAPYIGHLLKTCIPSLLLVLLDPRLVFGYCETDISLILKTSTKQGITSRSLGPPTMMLLVPGWYCLRS
jgi:hypothetical protein